MFCNNCGKEVNDSAVVCVHCGVMTGKNSTVNAPAKPSPRFIGFILSFIIPLAGLIVSIVELKKAKEEGSATGFAVAGIIISAITMAILLIYCIVIIAAASALSTMYMPLLVV